MNVVLILLLWQVAGEPPAKAEIAVDSVKTCVEQIDAYLNSDTAKKAAGVSAGCVVKNAPSTEAKDN